MLNTVRYAILLSLMVFYSTNSFSSHGYSCKCSIVVVRGYCFPTIVFHSIFEEHSLSSMATESLKEIMERGEAVRYAPVSTADIQNDIEGVKMILKEADNGWV